MIRDQACTGRAERCPGRYRWVRGPVRDVDIRCAQVASAEDVTVPPHRR